MHINYPSFFHRPSKLTSPQRKKRQKKSTRLTVYLIPQASLSCFWVFERLVQASTSLFRLLQPSPPFFPPFYFVSPSFHNNNFFSPPSLSPLYRSYVH